MTIVKTKTLVETYRAKAGAKDINELTGRTGRPDLTHFVIGQIVSKLRVWKDATLVDIGCGDGQLLKRVAANGLDSYQGRLIGVLPTKEEVVRVRNHLLDTDHLISIELGLAERTKFPNDFADVVVCNSVLHGGGQTIDNVKASLREIHRITKAGGTIFIGEVPDTDELAGRNYGDSISGWLLWVLKTQGLGQFWLRVKQTVPAFFSREPFIVAPKSMFYMPPADFVRLLEQHGIEVMEHYRHREIDPAGNVYDSTTRWDYVARKAVQ